MLEEVRFLVEAVERQPVTAEAAAAIIERPERVGRILTLLEKSERQRTRAWSIPKPA
jgi:hypothetical protein